LNRPKYKQKFNNALNVIDSVLDTLTKANELQYIKYNVYNAKEDPSTKLLRKRINNAIKQIQLYQSKEDA
jgi:hypothetical protein